MPDGIPDIRPTDFETTPCFQSLTGAGNTQSSSHSRPALDDTVAIPLVVAVSSTNMSARKQDAKATSVEIEYKNEGEVTHSGFIRESADGMTTWHEDLTEDLLRNPYSLLYASTYFARISTVGETTA